MHALHRLAALLALATLTLPALAHEYKAGSIRIGHPWARATVAGQQAGGAFLKLENQGSTPDRLLSVSAAIAASAEMHTMSMEGTVMRMRQIDAIDVPAGQTVELKPGSLHIMFMGLKSPLKVGDSIPVTLKFEKAGEVKVDVKVEALNPQSAPKSEPKKEEHKHH